MSTAKTIDYTAITKADMQPVKASELFKTDKALHKGLTALSIAGAAFYRNVHIAACSVLRRIGETGDVRIVHALFTVLPEGTRSNSLRDWFTAYGPLAFDGKKVSFVKDKEVELTKAINDPFWKFSPEKAYVPVDVVAMLEAMIKKLNKDKSETNTDHSAVINVLSTLKAAQTAPTVTA